MHVSSGILYNHESCRRGHAFVTQKIVQATVRISLGLQNVLLLGNLDAGRDWGHARDFADCMWRMLQLEEPQDFIVATGKSHTVRDFARLAFKAVGIDLDFKGVGLTEKGINKATGAVVLGVDPQFFRPAEPNQIIGDFGKAHKMLDWSPTYTIHDIIAEMVLAYKEKVLKNGF